MAADDFYLPPPFSSASPLDREVTRGRSGAAWWAHWRTRSRPTWGGGTGRAGVETVAWAGFPGAWQPGRGRHHLVVVADDVPMELAVSACLFRVEVRLHPWAGGATTRVNGPSAVGASPRRRRALEGQAVSVLEPYRSGR